METENGNGAIPYGPSYIEDGYTATVYIGGIRGLYGPCRVTYRPIMIMQQSKVTQQLTENANNAEARTRAIAAWMARQIISWTIKRENGSAVDAHNADDVLHIHPALFLRIWAIVLGEGIGDPDPEQRMTALDQENVIRRTENTDVYENEVADVKN